jgi:FkbM family methyltransferase
MEREPCDLPGYYLAKEFPIRVRIARWIGHQRWIPKGQEALLRMIIHPDRGYDLPFEVNFFAYRYRGNTNSFLDWRVLLYGAHSPYELSVLDRIARYLRRQGRRVVYLDIGANVGHHLLFMCGVADECHAVDPNGSVLERAREKIELNHIKNTKLYEIALGETNQTKPYFVPSAANEGTGSFLADWGSGGNSRTPIPAKIRKADEFLAEQGIVNVNIVKIDVEGFEPAVLRGLKPVFERERPFILLELSSEGFNELGGEAGLRSCVYNDAKVFRVSGDYRFAHSVEPHRFEPCESEILIVPAEYAEAF